ncbi:NAD(P)-dependent oxidoreductase [Kribbella turkmenica]|uniref:NAD(P)-dependent oxidoreductase n=1 Tax=Kribbella turkmenica TaxID=2530375 RepID=A0A4R4WGB5_9ACTN|nr:NAD(P)-dependent oxidoreductase [Kribbella turkmenica]TDD14525.1 NAD(P)-dependent oxidoreductase [Kribbella turkmenica]
MNVGFIGLGHMGGPMSLNLIRAGIPLVVHDLDKAAAEEHLALGATWADSPAELATQVDVLITMLPGPRQVESVLVTAGVTDALPEGSVWLDMSTSTPEVARRVGERLDTRGVSRLEAPVCGMAKGAKAGTLQIFVGGAEGVLERCRPLLDVMGDPERVFHVGPHGAGYAVKLMLNQLWFSHLVATTEVLTVGVKAGVDLAVLRRALVASSANSHFLEHDLASVLERGDYDESFAMALACKDLGLSVDLARDVGVPVELSAMVEQIYRRGRAKYGDLAGEMIPVRLYEELAGIELRVPVGE